MSGFVQNFSNYPPGVTGNEPELTGEETQGHTPGPWTIAGQHYPGPRHIYNSENRHVAVSHCSLGQAVTDANARLIAAAPDLLAACKAARSIFTEGRLAELESVGLITRPAPGTGMGIHSKICAAIAKAEGGGS